MAKSSSLTIKLHGLESDERHRDEEEGEPVGASDRTVPDVHLHIGDERRSRGGGGVHQHVYPATGEVQGSVPLADADDVDEAVQAASAAFETWRSWTPWQRRDVLVRLADLLEAAKDEFARLSVLDNGMTYGIAEFTATLDGRLRPLLRRLGRQGRGAGDLLAGPRPRARLHGPRALRRRRHHHHLERPARLGRHEGDAGPRRRQHGGGQALRADAVRPGALHGDRPGGRDPAGRRQRAPRDGRGRRGARPPPAGAEDQLHRRPDDRPHDPRRLRGDAEARGARAGRQVGEPGVPRRRSRCRGVHRHRIGAPDPGRPGLCPRHPARRARQRLRRARREGRHLHHETSRWATRSTRRPAWAPS